MSNKILSRCNPVRACEDSFCVKTASCIRGLILLILQNIVQCSLGVTWSLLYCLFGVLSKKETCFRDKKDKKGQRGQRGQIGAKKKNNLIKKNKALLIIVPTLQNKCPLPHHPSCPSSL